MTAPADLERLVRDELREPVAALVRRLVVELVHEDLNGAGNATSPALADAEVPGSRRALRWAKGVERRTLVRGTTHSHRPL